ncbi:MAG TPA: hypothetical protein QGH10_21095, partial [Armatimonadota bacterium]|nr:hypothetical protein [Armatimonadota bacterium]
RKSDSGRPGLGQPASCTNRVRRPSGTFALHIQTHLVPWAKGGLQYRGEAGRGAGIGGSWAV